MNRIHVVQHVYTSIGGTGTGVARSTVTTTVDGKTSTTTTVYANGKTTTTRS